MLRRFRHRAGWIYNPLVIFMTNLYAPAKTPPAAETAAIYLNSEIIHTVSVCRFDPELPYVSFPLRYRPLLMRLCDVIFILRDHEILGLGPHTSLNNIATCYFSNFRVWKQDTSCLFYLTVIRITESQQTCKNSTYSILCTLHIGCFYEGWCNFNRYKKRLEFLSTIVWPWW